MVLSLVTQGCESWTIKKAECQRIDAFELWCWRRSLRVPSTARRCNQSILKEISPEYSLQGLMLKLKLQHFGHLMPRANSLEKTLMLRKMEGRRRRGWQRTRWLDGITNSIEMSLTEVQEMVEDTEALSAAVHGVTGLGHDWLNNITKSLNRILQPSVSRLTMSGNSYFTEPGWGHNHLIVVGTRNEWLGLPQTHRRTLGRKGSCHSGKHFDERD